jgi:hypothetical protein
MLHWGETCLVEASGIDNKKLSSFPHVAEFIASLPSAIGMRAYGQPLMQHFGRPGHREFGWTAVQLLTTSHCAVHCCETVGELYLDITSCRPVVAAEVEAHVKAYFGRDIQFRIRHLHRDPIITIS